MKPVMQTKRGGEDAPLEERGDCLNAALASILEVPIERVVISWSEDEHWWDSTQRAVKDHGYELVVASTHIWPGTYWIATVPSLNLGGGETHAIVMRDGEVAHDPTIGAKRYEVGTYIDDIDVQAAWVLVPLEYGQVAA